MGLHISNVTPNSFTEQLSSTSDELLDIGSISSCFLRVKVMVFDFETFKSIQFCLLKWIVGKRYCSCLAGGIGDHRIFCVYRMVNSRVVSILDIIGIAA